MLGSGETLASSGKTHEFVAQHSPEKPNIVILETPAGFEPNSFQVADKIRRYLEKRLQNYKPEINVLRARKRGTEHSPDNPDVVSPILKADEILLGPGSPTYGARQLRGSLAARMIQARHALGGILFLSSSSTLAFSRYTMPVYEIYKVGQDLHWQDGVDFLAPYGLKTVVIPHWDNTDGGDDLDTSRCYMGQDRFGQLLSLLPQDEDITIIGIDEHTSLVLDFEERCCHILGNSSVTIIRGGKEKRFETGSKFSLDELGDWQLPTAEMFDEDVWHEALIAEAERHLPQETDLPSDEVVSLVKSRLEARESRDWGLADQLRDQVEALGWKILDTKDGYELEPL